MFPLKTAALPSSASALEQCLNESLRELFVVARDPVAIREASYPHLSELSVSLDGAQLRGQPPAIPSLSTDPVPALDVDSLND